jgi:hypothetical protein
MSSENTVRAMDTDNGADLSVTISQAASGEHVVLLAETSMIPGVSIQLTHREAHQLAVYLLEQSAEAEMREDDRRGDGDPRIDVPMVCTACRKPAVQSKYGPGWLHGNPDDASACPRTTAAITVMVAAGNETIPFDVAKPAMSVQIDA